MASRQRYRQYVGPTGKPHPPGQPDPREGEAPLRRMADEQDELGNPMEVPDRAPGLDDPDSRGYREGRGPSAGDVDQGEDAERDEGDGLEEDEDPDWETRARNAYNASTDFMDANFRKPLEDALKAFNNQHPSDSKYNSESFRKRSNLYRPKIRTIVRKNEAALCAALFSNLDLIEVSAANPGEREEIVSAEVMQQLLQERLTVSMPWFQFAMGAIQDAQTQGIVIAHSYWDYSGGHGPGGTYRVKRDRPVQELIPAENFRFDPGAKWYDVVNTSPYLIELIPMYVGEVMDKMRYPDPKGRRWNYIPEEEIASCRENQDESTRMARTGLQQDQTQHAREVREYDIVWVHRHIHRWRGEDYEFYMLASKWMLTDPEPLEENVWFGERPYVVGTCVIETHKAMPNSMLTLLRPLADEANDLQNQGSDNMKFILNKAWFVKRSANVDTSSLVRNVPGRVTMVNDPEKDVKEVSWPDLPRSLYEEKNRNDADFDNLAGNFNPMTLQQTRSPRESFRTVNAVQSPAMMMTEYTLMTLVQTFLLPCLRQLVLLEQYYETDQVMLAVAGQKAKVMQRFGVSEVTDAILEKRLSVNVNIGMGATDPTTKQQRFGAALGLISNLSKQPPPGLDLKEVFKEALALAGYRDAIRFFTDQDPEKTKLLMTIKQLTQKLQVQEIDKRNKHESNVIKLVTSREGNLTKLALAAKEDDHQSRHLLIGHLLEMEKVDKQAEQQRTLQAEGAMQAQAQQAQGATQQQALAKQTNAQGGKAA